MKIPTGVNLPYLPEILRMIAKCIRDYPLATITVGDFRHFFHQIPLHEDISKWFGVGTDDNHMYRWNVLPMGHSHSPHTAQCLGWLVLLHCEPGEEQLFHEEDLEAIRKSTTPPQYVRLKNGGFATLFYDNFIAVTALMQ